MSHAQSAETFARQVPAKRTPEEKLDAIWRLACRPVPIRGLVELGAQGEKVKNTATRWTPEDDHRFRALAEAGRTAAVISERLKRSQAAVYLRARKLGIRLRRTGRKAKGK